MSYMRVWVRVCVCVRVYDRKDCEFLMCVFVCVKSGCIFPLVDSCLS